MTAPVLFQFLPPLSPEEYSSLEASIREHGVQVPIVLDENGVVIDGHHRQKIAQELGVHCPRTHVYDLSEAEKRTLALTLNLDRRNLTREQRRAIVEASLKADPQLSNREHARRTGVSPSTVTAVRDRLGSGVQVGHLHESEASDHRSPAPREVVDRETGEIVTDTPTVTGQTIQTTEHVVIAQTRHLDLDDQPDDEPEEQPRVTGRDGKSYPAQREPQAPRRKSLPDQFWTALYDAEHKVDALRKLIDDDRFAANRQSICDRNIAVLNRTASTLAEVLAAVHNEPNF